MNNKSAEIVLHIQSVKDLFFTSKIPLSCKRILNSDVEEFIIEEAEDLPRNAPIRLTVHVAFEETLKTDEVTAAIHKHFAYCKEKSEKKLKKTLGLGWRSFLIGFIFLIIMFALIKVIVTLFPKSAFIQTVQESFVILSWVALWRPAELLLYEWYPFKRDANLFDRLAKCKVHIVNGQHKF